MEESQRLIFISTEEVHGLFHSALGTDVPSHSCLITALLCTRLTLAV